MKLALAAFASVTAICSASSHAQTPAATTVITHVRLIDGRGGAPLDDASMAIEDGRVTAAGQHVPIPPGARVIDLQGRAIMPGLISDHSHVGLVDGVTVAPANYNRANILRQLRQYEAYGVTSVTALGLSRPALFDALRIEMHAGTTAGADLFGVDAGIGAPAGAPPENKMPVADDQIFRPSTPEEARQAVDAMAAHHTDLVKLWLDDLRNNVDQPGRPKMRPEVYTAVIDEAHAKGLRVAAHIYDLDDAKALVAAGVDIIAHGVRDRPVDGAFITAMKARGVWYIPTIGLDESSYLFAEHPEMLNDPFFARALQPDLGPRSKTRPGERRLSHHR